MGVAPSSTRATSGAATTRSSGATGQYVARFEIRISSRTLRGILDPFRPTSRGHGNYFVERAARLATVGEGAGNRQYIQTMAAWHGQCSIGWAAGRAPAPERSEP